MTERKKLSETIAKAEKTMEEAEKRLDGAKRNEPERGNGFHEAQLSLEEMSHELDALARMGTREQREQIGRTLQQIRQLQNRMILNH
ncbi:DUF2524 family protein [Halalkalibacterium ligniniphilum]|uniref:DUF2524 family protein n=1 Tax=Halalkalibacterium ligniniphilum TaxID=1134413 RepID=UPI0003487648|nr:DUF2524 family protein [Halalkalibacterium ligniniphilum]